MHIRNSLKLGGLTLGFAVLACGIAQRPAQTQTYIPVPVYKYYGAFAYSKSANYSGVSWNGSTRQEAEEAALQSCSRGAEDCFLVAWFSNQCGSLASTPDGVYGLGINAVSNLAERFALEECNELGGVGCKTKFTFCSNEISSRRTLSRRLFGGS